MGEVRMVAPQVVEQFFEMIHDASLAVDPFAVHYDDFVVNADRLQLLDRRNAATYQLLSEGAEAGQWGAQRAIRVLLRRAGTKLEQAFQYPHGWRDLVYDIGNAWQTDTELLIGFRLLSGGAGRNRWFGRRDGKIETRSPQAMETLAGRLRQELHRAFSAQNPGTDTGLPEQWLTVARLPLVNPTTLVATTATKTVLVRQLSQALVVGEVLRRQSFDRIEPPTTHMRYPLNQILFGPPGTGKTYATAAWAVAIIEGRKVNEVEAEYDANREALQALLQTYRLRGQVEFVTFHQSFSYEDFVEGIKPTLATDEEDEEAEALSYRIEPGVFRTLSERGAAAVNLWHQQQGPSSAAVATPLDFTSVYTQFLAALEDKQSKGEEVIFKTKSDTAIVFDGFSPKGNLWVRHKKGQKEEPFTVSGFRLRKLYDKFKTVAEIQNVTNDITATIKGANTSAYWAVFNAFKEFEGQVAPVASPMGISNKTAWPNLLQGLVADPAAAKLAADKLDYAQVSAKDLADAPRFVLIIDEINRGNVSSIFGELITLLEDDKRGGQLNAMNLKLPYSKVSFQVPPNLYLLGTMNTADRSIEALDTALRRRFSFSEMAPKPHLLKPVAGVELGPLLTALNERIEYLSSRDHCLGHAWLMGVSSLEELRDAFQHKIIPQLQEYFYGNWARIRQILGKAFVEKLTQKVSLLDTVDEYDERPTRYRITAPDQWTIETFQGLYAVNHAPLIGKSATLPGASAE